MVGHMGDIRKLSKFGEPDLNLDFPNPGRVRVSGLISHKILSQVSW
jgi:hypothetical protein